MAERTYGIKYTVEPGEFAIPDTEGERVAPGIRVQEHAGYADDIFVVSVVRSKDGELNFLLMGTWQGEVQDPQHLPKEMLLKIREAIDHHLEHHAR